MSEDEPSMTAAEILALAEEAEAEAAEAEALAAVARARTRALQLRRRAETAGVSESSKQDDSQDDVDAPAETAPQEDSAATAEPEADATVEADVEAETEEPEAAAAPAVEDQASSDDAEEEADDADEEADDADEGSLFKPRSGLRPSRRPERFTVATSVAILIIVAALSGTGYMIYAHHEAEQQRQLVAEFTKAARQEIINLTSLDFTDAKGCVQRVLDNSTGEFKDQFTKSADALVETLGKLKVHSQGTVQAAAVDRESMTSDTAVVLIAATQEVTNETGAKKEPHNYQFVVTVQREAGQLKISKVESQLEVVQ